MRVRVGDGDGGGGGGEKTDCDLYLDVDEKKAYTSFPPSVRSFVSSLRKEIQAPPTQLPTKRPNLLSSSSFAPTNPYHYSHEKPSSDTTSPFSSSPFPSSEGRPRVRGRGGSPP